MEAKTTNVSHKTLFFQHDSHNEGLSQTIPIKKTRPRKTEAKTTNVSHKNLIIPETTDPNKGFLF